VLTVEGGGQIVEASGKGKRHCRLFRCGVMIFSSPAPSGQNHKDASRSFTSRSD
jgi:hypothetical protein